MIVESLVNNVGLEVTVHQLSPWDVTVTEPQSQYKMLKLLSCHMKFGCSTTHQEKHWKKLFLNKSVSDLLFSQPQWCQLTIILVCHKQVSDICFTATQKEATLSDVFNIVSVVNENEMEIVSGAILVNEELQTISADEACVVVETVNTQEYFQVNVNDVDEVAGDIVLC